MRKDEKELVGGLIGFGIMGCMALTLNLGVLALSVYVVVKVLQWTGVL